MDEPTILKGMFHRHEDFSKFEQGKKVNYGLILGFVALFLVLLIFISATSLVVKAADVMMRREGKDVNILAENLVPNHDSIAFKSADGHATLGGWFFHGRGDVIRGNIILVHDNLNHRMQFDLNTADLFSFLQNEGFNVLAFDLRHSGNSSGDISAYGYLEYQDVLAAMQLMKRMTGREDFILMAWGSGCAASLMAWEALPEEVLPENERRGIMRDIDFSRDAIEAMIFDTITASADDYIRADIQEEGFMNKYLYRPFIPLAIRLSASHARANLSPLLAQVQAPVMITRNLPDTRLPESAIEEVIQERLRLKKELTFVWETAQPGSATGWLQDPENYEERLVYFLDRWFTD